VTGPDAAVTSALDQASVQLRAPWAASLAGLLFAAFFTAALVLMRSSPLTAADDAELIRLFVQGRDQWLFVGAMYLAPFAGIMFLWFIAVIRDQIGEREDRFFATVFFGSGLLFVALLFAAAAVAGSVVVGYRYLGLDAPTAAETGMVRALSYTLLFGFSTRAAAVFLISLGTIGLRSRTFPKWFAWTGYLFGIVLFLFVTFWDWILLVLPVWVAVVSLFILRRERGRRRTPTATSRVPARSPSANRSGRGWAGSWTTIARSSSSSTIRPISTTSSARPIGSATSRSPAPSTAGSTPGEPPADPSNGPTP
jgi:hypothetical protein